VRVHLYGASIHTRPFFVGFKTWGKLHSFNPKLNLLTFFQHGFGVEKWVNKHGGQNNVAIQTTYILYVCVLEFLEGEWAKDAQTPVEWNKHKNLPTQMDVNQSTITLGILGIG
jgi:hypothetical protein